MSKISDNMSVELPTKLCFCKNKIIFIFPRFLAVYSIRLWAEIFSVKTIVCDENNEREVKRK